MIDTSTITIVQLFCVGMLIYTWAEYIEPKAEREISLAGTIGLTIATVNGIILLVMLIKTLLTNDVMYI